MQSERYGKLPLVYPLIYYSGKQEYNLSTDITDIIDAPQKLVQQILFKKIQLVELNKQKKNSSANEYIETMETLLNNHKSSFIGCLKKISFLLNRLKKKDQPTIIKIIRYIINVTEDDTTEAIIKTVENSLSDNTVDRVMTLADRLRQEGMQQGLNQTAKNLRSRGFLIEEIAGITNLSIEEIKKLQDKE